MKNKTGGDSVSSHTTSVKTPGDVYSPENNRNEVITASIGAATAAGKFAYEAIKDFRNSQEPFFVSVVNSGLQDNFHVVSFELRNNTLHGLIVEEAWIALPEERDKALRDVFYSKSESEMSFGGAKKQTPKLLESMEPFRVPPGGQPKTFYIGLPVLTPQKKHQDVPYLIATFNVSHLNEKQPTNNKYKVDFRVRWKGVQ
jgi:hypothetical protein